MTAVNFFAPTATPKTIFAECAGQWFSVKGRTVSRMTVTPRVAPHEVCTMTAVTRQVFATEIATIRAAAGV